MTIAPGDTLPDATLMLVTASTPEPVRISEYLNDKKVVIIAVPGAFTPTCSAQHLPSLMENADAIKAKGVDEIVCVAVNDPFVLKAWAEDQGTDGIITMLADGSGLFTKALGLELDLIGRGLGVRSQRYAMIVDDLKVLHLPVAPPGAFGVRGGAAIMDALG